MIELHPFQSTLKDRLYRSWSADHRRTICVLPTGGGKTVLMSKIAVEVNEPMCAIAHRQELVQQISMAMMRMDLAHNIIAPKQVVSAIVQTMTREAGFSYYDPSARLTVAGVNTLNARSKKLSGWASGVRYWAGDECHHFLTGNQWGKAVDMFPHARGVGFTASPIRCDRKSLARDQGGVFDDMCVGASMRELIDDGFLADYRIFAPPQSIDTDTIKISSSTGDFTRSGLQVATDKSTITGDIVQHYKRFANGKRGITFAVSVESAEKIAAAFNAAGVPAAAVSGNTPDTVRNDLVRKFVDGKILQLVNVDLFGEGFDVPAVEVVSMGRPTQSLGLYIQQFGRALRSAPGKTHGMIIDHVGNVKRHGLPDAIRNWSLISEERGKRVIRDPDVMPPTTCVECFRAYEAVHKACPYCGHISEPESRAEPKFVDGDLIELDPAALAVLRGQADLVRAPFDSMTDVPAKFQGTALASSIRRKYEERQAAHAELDIAISEWAGVRRHRGMADSEIYRRFFHTFGTDVATARGLREKQQVVDLTAKIKARWWNG